MIRAMWKANIAVGKLKVPIKLYSAIEDRSIKFRMLHRKDQAPVEQHIVRKDTREEVPASEIRKAYAVSNDTAVVLQPEDLEKLTPAESRDITLLRFVDPHHIDDQWYDRPYYLGPDEGTESYAAFAQALAESKLTGIASWVMRKKRYVGALTPVEGFLALTTMRRADQILSFAGVKPTGKAKPQANELKLAQQLVESISSDFDPAFWKNDHRLRLLKMIDAKAHGKALAPVRIQRRKAPQSLADNLKASLAAVREKKIA